jgi:hypothetical protein
VIDLSFLRKTLGSAGAGLRRHAGDHALGLLVGGGAALSVIAAGIAVAAIGGHGSGGGGGGGGAGGAAGTPSSSRATGLQGSSGDGVSTPGAGHPHLGSESVVSALIQGRAPSRTPVSPSQVQGALAGEDQPHGSLQARDASFESGSRPMLAMAGNRFDPIGLGVRGGYGGRANAAQANDPTPDPVAPLPPLTPTTDPVVPDPAPNVDPNPTKIPQQIPAVPEPETYALMLAGLGVLGWQVRRRRAGAQRHG